MADHHTIQKGEIAGYAAELPVRDGVLCYGYGATSADAIAAAHRQFAGAQQYWRGVLREITARPVGPDEASEILEMLATPVYGFA